MNTCHCYVCWLRANGPKFQDRMFLCPTCGNKRCPHATHHEEACSRSNEPGQDGSVYGNLVVSVGGEAAPFDVLVTKGGAR